MSIATMEDLLRGHPSLDARRADVRSIPCDPAMRALRGLGFKSFSVRASGQALGV